MGQVDVPAYGLWGLVFLNSAIFVAFAFSFFKPQTKTDWRSITKGPSNLKQATMRATHNLLSTSCE